MKIKLLGLLGIVALLICSLPFVPALADTSENEVQIYTILTGAGYNTAAACGILANIQQESGFNPERVGGPSTGLCQWTGGRWTRLQSYCADNGCDYLTVTGQTDYLLYELNNYYPSVKDHLLACPNTPQGAYDAGHEFCYDFERPTAKTTSSITRGNNARDVYFPKYINGLPAVDSGAGQAVAAAAPTVVYPPAPVLNVDPDTLTHDTQVHFSWKSTAHTTGYDLRIFQNGILVRFLPGLSATDASCSLANGDYTASLASVNADQGVWTFSGTISFTVAVIYPAAPILTVDPGTLSAGQPVQFHWGATSITTYYDLRIMQNGNVVIPLLGIYGLSASCPLPAGDYTATLASVNADQGVWTFGDAISFTVAPSSGTTETAPPNVTRPTGATSVKPAAEQPILFQWATTSRTTAYDVRIMQNGASVKFIQNITGSNCAVSLAPGVYTAYVNADSNNPYGLWTAGTSVTFTVADMTGGDLKNLNPDAYTLGQAFSSELGVLTVCYDVGK